MHLQKLVIQGFKSFANKTSLEFTPGITAIVGPNGSGKSNAADAIRWVLGEQSLKTLRGKKSGDVIFAGSDKKTRLGYCQVDLHLDNQDHQAPIDYPEIIISRRIYRDGNGEYFINKNKVRLQDILMLLAKSNFGQRSYSIISQGTVDLFLSATPAQRKEYFDEAAGVRQFQIKKDQAINKLRQTKENLKQGDMLMQEIEPRLRSLTRQVNRLEKREEVTKQLKEIQHKYYAGLWHDHKKNHKLEEEKFSKIEETRKQTDNELNEIQKKMQQLAMGTSRQEDFENLQKKYDQIIEEKNKLLREQTVVKGRTEIDRKKAGDFDLVWLEKKQEQIKSEIDKSKQDNQNLDHKINKLNKELSESEGEQDKLDNQYKDIEDKLAVAKNKLANNKTIAIPEVAENIASIYFEQKIILEKIEAAQNIDDLQTIIAEAKIITSKLAQLNHKLSDSGIGDPHEIISLQDQITKLLNSKNDYVSIINEKQVALQISKEKKLLSTNTISEQEDELNKITKELDLAKSNKTPQEIATDLAKEDQELNEKIKNTEASLQKINNQLGNFNQAEQDKKEKVFSLQNTYSSKQEELNKIIADINNIKIELAKLETRLEDLEKEMIDELNDEERNVIYKVKTPPPVNTELFSEIQKLKKTLELIGGIDPQVSQEYKETKERFDFLSDQTEDLNKAIEDLEQVIDSLDETIKKQFSIAFENINKQFSEYFKILFNGGAASLNLIKEYKQIVMEESSEDDNEDEDDDSENSEEEIKKEVPQQSRGEKVITGIDMKATPPGKKMQGISMLSGGERALTSIALICAIIHNNPSPFVVLDEVDAALDESNSIRFASIVKKLSTKSQFIVITHNRATMEEAHTLYGVTMGDDGVSKLLSINMQEAEQVIANN
ncbi:MAG: chromosome segregation SMC family protein [Candidatus Kerfeldbacteria bacterium]